MVAVSVAYILFHLPRSSIAMRRRQLLLLPPYLLFGVLGSPHRTNESVRKPMLTSSARDSSMSARFVLYLQQLRGSGSL